MSHTGTSSTRRVLSPQGLRLRPLAFTALTMTLALMVFTPASSLALPEGRHYEMVSPVYKGGYGATQIVAVAPDGESVAFSSLGSFAGADTNNATSWYLARRGGSGWSTASVMPPGALDPFGLAVDFSASLGSTLGFGIRGPDVGFGTYESNEAEYLLHANDMPDTVASWEGVGGIVIKRVGGSNVGLLAEGGASADLCHVLVEGQKADNLSLEAEGTNNQVYDLSRGCGGQPPSFRLVGLDNEGKPLAPDCTWLGGHDSVFGAISADGSEVFFTVQVGRHESCGPLSAQVFVRLADQSTLEVSRPLVGECVEVPCPGAATRAPSQFEGASEDSSRVFFTTTEQLTGSDTDGGSDLYMASIGCPPARLECGVVERVVTGLVQVSHDPTAGAAAEVQRVVAVAPDGSRAYFVARDDLLSQGAREALEGEGRAVPRVGADNLYMYDSATGGVGFVGDLCAGPKVSGVVVDAQCSSDLTRPDQQGVGRDDVRMSVQTGGEDARFLVFSTYAQLVAGDTDNAKDVYRYDAQTGALDRVSVGEAGYDANGNRNDEPPYIYGRATAGDANIAAGEHVGLATVIGQHTMEHRAVNEDGSRIVFTSAEPLSPDARNGLENAYEWHKEPGWSDGRVSLVSTGRDEEAVSDVVISPSGGDLFFQTVQGLVPQDTDGAVDVYDARLGGGFPVVPAEPQSCSGDACQGPLTNPAPLLVPGSVSQAPGESFSLPKTVVKKKPRVSVKKRKSKRKAKRAAHGGSARRGRGRR
jgi:hypothetical protein